MKNFIKLSFIYLLIIFFLLEIGSFVASKFGLLVKNETPALYGGVALKDSARFARTEEQKWGGWRPINSVSRQVSECFNVEVRSNEIGARDSTFVGLKDNALFLLGDSMAEGFGVSYESTSQYLLEKKLNKDIYNFSVGHTFGPLQELLIYEEYKNKYTHHGVIVYISLVNDFTDNDRLWWEKVDTMRYRPYFSTSGDPLIPWYFPNAKKTIYDFEHASLKLKFISFVIDNFWFSNTIRTVRALFKYSMKGEYPGYFYARDYQQIHFGMAHSKIVDLAEDRDVLFVVIPSRKEIYEFAQLENPTQYKNQIWFRKLLELSERKNVHFLDLMMSQIPEDVDSLFLCDGHWSNDGNKWAAKEIYEFIDAKNIFK